MNTNEFTKQCKLCGAEMPKHSKTCGNCGAIQKRIMTAKLKPCRKCGVQISTDVKKCPHCKAVPSNIIVANVLSFFVIFFATVGIVAVIGSSGTSSDSQIEKEAITTPEEDLVYTTAVDMINEYKENEIAADLKYDGKTVVVTGVVSDLGKTVDFITEGTPYVLFSSAGTSSYFGTIQANFSNKSEIEKLANISKGQQVSIKGTCSGESTINIMLYDCFVIEE